MYNRNVTEIFEIFNETIATNKKETLSTGTIAKSKRESIFKQYN